MTALDPDEHSRRLAAESLADDDPTGWFERLYAQASDGEAVVPWDRGVPNRLLVISGAREEGEPVDDPPPWPLTPAEIDAFAAGALRMVGLEKRHNPDFPRARFWRAEYGRPAV